MTLTFPLPSSQISPFALVLHLAPVLLVAWILNALFIRPFSDPLRLLPGPARSFFSSNLQDILDPRVSNNAYTGWRRQFGRTFKFHGFGWDYRLMTFDVKAMIHIMNTPTYERPWQTRSFLSRLLGKGIFTNEGPTHLRQRTVLHIAFRNLSIEHLEPAFFNKAEALADRWTEALSLRSDSDDIRCRSVNDSQKDSAVIDVGEWMSRASFDAMGLASFNFDFRTIQNESEDVYDAYRQRLAVMDKGVGIWGALNSYLPIIRNTGITRDMRIMNTSLRTIDTTVKSIVAQTKAASKGVSAEQDLFSSLIESNLSVGQSDRLADATLLEQCSTLLLTGSDTVCVALSWCLHFLAKYPEVQARLRDELYDSTSCEADDMSDTSSDSGYEEHCVSCKAKTMQMAMPYKCSCHLKGARWKVVSSLRYLDSVVRETLRLCPPIQNIVRVATCDDTIPLFFPVSLANGTTRHQETSYIPIRKGSYVHIPIDGLNQCEDIWGPDAAEFKPSRWETATLPSLPSVDYPLSFGMGNHHSCLGHRLALAHIKIFLATLLPRFEFNPAEGIEISKFGSTLTRPYVQGKWSDGSQLPLRVRKLQ